MIIQGEDFVMELVEGTERFDLKLIHVVNAKIPEKRREEFKEAGYAMSREKCLEIIINDRLKRKKDVYTPTEYLKEFKAERIALKEIFNEA